MTLKGQKNCQKKLLLLAIREYFIICTFRKFKDLMVIMYRASKIESLVSWVRFFMGFDLAFFALYFCLVFNLRGFFATYCFSKKLYMR